MDTVSQKAIAPTVLVAIPDVWGILVSQLLEQHGCSVLMASSQDEARTILQSHDLSGAVIISDWALTSNDGETIGLMEIARDKVPTVCLITSKTWSQAPERWLEELYHPPRHEYCSVPVGTDELLARLNQVMQKAEVN